MNRGHSVFILYLYNQHHNHDTVKISTQTLHQHHSTQDLTFLYADRSLKTYMLKSKRKVVFYILWILRNHQSATRNLAVSYINAPTNYLVQNFWDISNQYPSFVGVWHTFILTINNLTRTQIPYIMTTGVSQHDFQTLLGTANLVFKTPAIKD